MKGDPAEVLARCSKILINGKETNFDKKNRDEVNNTKTEFEKRGETVLAFANFSLPAKKFTKDYKFDV